MPSLQEAFSAFGQDVQTLAPAPSSASASPLDQFDSFVGSLTQNLNQRSMGQEIAQNQADNLGFHLTEWLNSRINQSSQEAAQNAFAQGQGESGVAPPSWDTVRQELQQEFPQLTSQQLNSFRGEFEHNWMQSFRGHLLQQHAPGAESFVRDPFNLQGHLQHQVSHLPFVQHIYGMANRTLYQEAMQRIQSGQGTFNDYQIAAREHAQQGFNAQLQSAPVGSQNWFANVVGPQISNQLGYVGEYALTSGALGAGTGAGTAVAGAAGRVLPAGAARALGGVANYAVGTAAQEALNPLAILNQQHESQQPSYFLELTPAGPQITRQEAQNPLSLIGAIGHQYAELFGERLGSMLIPGVVGRALQGVGRGITSLTGQIPRFGSGISRFLGATGRAILGAEDALSKNTGWNGLLPEFMEERATEVMQYLGGTEPTGIMQTLWERGLYNLHNLWSGDFRPNSQNTWTNALNQTATELAGFSLFAAGHSSLNRLVHGPSAPMQGTPQWEMARGALMMQLASIRTEGEMEDFRRQHPNTEAMLRHFNLTPPQVARDLAEFQREVQSNIQGAIDRGQQVLGQPQQGQTLLTYQPSGVPNGTPGPPQETPQTAPAAAQQQVESQPVSSPPVPAAATAAVPGAWRNTGTNFTPSEQVDDTYTDNTNSFQASNGATYYLASRTTEKGGVIYRVFDSAGNEVARNGFFPNKQGTWNAEGLQVAEGHRKLGVGEAIYDHFTSTVSSNVVPAPNQSAAGKKFWERNRRPVAEPAKPSLKERMLAKGRQAAGAIPAAEGQQYASSTEALDSPFAEQPEQPSEREKYVLEQRQAGRSLRDLGRELGVSYEQIRLIEGRARQKVGQEQSVAQVQETSKAEAAQALRERAKGTVGGELHEEVRDRLDTFQAQVESAVIAAQEQGVDPVEHLNATMPGWDSVESDEQARKFLKDLKRRQKQAQQQIEKEKKDALRTERKRGLSAQGAESRVAESVRSGQESGHAREENRTHPELPGPGAREPAPTSKPATKQPAVPGLTRKEAKAIEAKVRKEGLEASLESPLLASDAAKEYARKFAADLKAMKDRVAATRKANLAKGQPVRQLSGYLSAWGGINRASVLKDYPDAMEDVPNAKAVFVNGGRLPDLEQAAERLIGEGHWPPPPGFQLVFTGTGRQIVDNGSDHSLGDWLMMALQERASSAEYSSEDARLQAEHEAYARQLQEQEQAEADEERAALQESSALADDALDFDFGFGQPLTEEERHAGNIAGGQENATPSPSLLRQTALANRMVDEERAKNKLPPLMSAARLANPQVWDQAMFLLDQNPNAGTDLVDELFRQTRATTVQENALLLHRKIALSNEHRRTMSQYIALIPQRLIARRQGNTARVAEIDAKQDTLEIREKFLLGQIDKLDRVTRSTGTEWGRAGQFRRQLAAEDFSLAGMLLQAQRAKKAELTSEEKQEIAALQKQIEELQAKVAELESTGQVKPGQPSEPDYQLTKAKKKFQQRLYNWELQSAPWHVRAFRLVHEAINFPRSIMAAIDFPVGRQGWIPLLSRPILTARAIPQMLRAFVSEEAADRAQYELSRRPNSHLYEKAGLDLTYRDGKLNEREEGFLSRLVGKVPVLGHSIRASERAYQTFLNRIRADLFDALSATLARQGKLTDAEAKIIANYANVVTGRGPLGQAEKTGTLLAQVFFAPRYALSRFQYLTGQPLWTQPGSGGVAARKIIFQEYGRFLAGLGLVVGSAILAGFRFEPDPRSAEFGKLKIGNTRLDLLGGLGGALRLLAQTFTLSTKTATGKVHSLRDPNVPYGQGNYFVTFGRFFRGKLAPAPSTVLNWLSGSDLVGQPVTIQSTAASLGMPLFARDVYQAMLDLGVARGTAVSLLGLMGVGMNTYDPMPPGWWPGLRFIDGHTEPERQQQLQLLHVALQRMEPAQRNGIIGGLLISASAMPHRQHGESLAHFQNRLDEWQAHRQQVQALLAPLGLTFQQRFELFRQVWVSRGHPLHGQGFVHHVQQLGGL